MAKIAYLFDIDNTLIDTTAKIIVRDKNKNIVKKLTTKEFDACDTAKFERNGYHFDFTEFDSITKLKSEAKLAGWYALVTAAKQSKYVYIATARSCQQVISRWLESEGVHIDRNNIMCFDASDYESVHMFKRCAAYAINMAHQEMGEPVEELIFWEDNLSNIVAVAGACQQCGINLCHYSS